MDEPESRWGDSAVDTRERSLPGLKARYLVDQIQDGASVVEIGCGNGKLLRTIDRHRSHLTLHGCDIKAPDAPPDVYEFRMIDGTTLPYDDESFDVALLFDVLEHVPDPRSLLTEAARILKPGGQLVAFVPIKGETLSPFTLYRALLGKDTYVISKEHIQEFTHDALKALVDEHFSLVDRRYVYHWLGGFMDATFFAAARLKTLRTFWWKDNVYYNQKRETKPSSLSRALNQALKLGNAIAWAESSLFERIESGSVGELIVATKR